MQLVVISLHRSVRVLNGAVGLDGSLPVVVRRAMARGLRRGGSMVSAPQCSYVRSLSDSSWHRTSSLSPTVPAGSNGRCSETHVGQSGRDEKGDGNRAGWWAMRRLPIRPLRRVRIRMRQCSRHPQPAQRRRPALRRPVTAQCSSPRHLQSHRIAAAHLIRSPCLFALPHCSSSLLLRLSPSRPPPSSAAPSAPAPTRTRLALCLSPPASPSPPWPTSSRDTPPPSTSTRRRK